MAVKIVDVPGVGPVKLYKRRGTHSIRLSIAANGDIRVTLPHWAPYAAGTSFAIGKQAWIREHQQSQPLLQDNQAVGKLHTLRFAYDPAASRPSARKQANFIIVRHAAGSTWSDDTVQQTARQAVIRALRSEASTVLPGRLQRLAEAHGFEFSSVAIKQLTGRWGSCDQDKSITLNLFLMQLPWPLIDYVLLHELTHTRIMRHGPDFWQAMAAVLPSVHMCRQTIKQHRPVAGG